MTIGRTAEAYALLAATVEADGAVRLSTPGRSAPNIRLASAMGMLRELVALAHARRPRGRGLVLLQFDDSTHHAVRSVAFGRPVGFAPLVELIVDPYFYFSRGFASLRGLAEAGGLPAWSERSDVLFWRGRGSHRGVRADGGPVRGLAEVPRIALALRLRDDPRADVGLIGPWMQAESDAEAQAFLERERIWRPFASMEAHARYRHQLDIDGVANPWATLERFLCGSCVLRVGSPFEMWCHDAMRPWEHFVPLRPDASDLEEKLEWCLLHPREAEGIARAGQAVALELSYEVAVGRAVEAIGRVWMGA